MEQRIYHGRIEPNALADYLVGVFNQNPGYPGHHNYHHTMAQRVGQGEHVLVQIMHTSDWSGRGGSLGVNISRIAGGVSVSMGQSNWLDLDDTGLAGMLLGALFFPPLLIFPLVQGLSHSTFYQDVWDAIDAYCMRAGSRPGGANAPQGFYCPYCGSLNHPGATHCHACDAPFNFAPPSQASQQPPASKQPAPSTENVVCPTCGATVAATKFCGNCAAPLR